MRPFAHHRVPLALAAAVLLGGALQALAAPKIDAQADQHLKAMCSLLAGLRTFSLTAQESYDESPGSGGMVQVSNQRRVTVRRPDRLAGEATGDTANREFYYDGQTATLFDRTQKVYAVVKVPGTIDAMLDRMVETYGVSQPLADFLFTDPHKVLTERVVSGRYVGKHQVGGGAAARPCHHLAFQQAEIDWQLWIDAGERPFPRKLLIVYKKAPGAPRYTATLDEWDLSLQTTDETFTFKAPDGARKIEVLSIAGIPAPTSSTRRK